MSMDFGGIGDGISGIFSGVGDLKAASGYKRASAIAATNSKIAQSSTAIQETQAQREIYRTMGTQQADIGAAGLATSGSALDIMRDSASQGALTKSLVQNQGTITSLGYQQESASLASQAAAAKAKGAGGILSGIVKIAAAAAMVVAL